jgi:hypothetical protein
MTSAELAELYRRDLTRLGQQVRAFADETLLWQTLQGVENSAGNLMLHLEGNLREYVGRQLGGIPYTRVRPREFSDRDVPREELIHRIDDIALRIPAVIEGLTVDGLDATYPENVLGVPMSVGQFLIHLYGHLNYHLGQIDYLRRILSGSGAIEYARL